MLPEITTASIKGQRKENKEKICIAIISPNEMSRAFQTHCNIEARSKLPDESVALEEDRRIQPGWFDFRMIMATTASRILSIAARR